MLPHPPRLTARPHEADRCEPVADNGRATTVAEIFVDDVVVSNGRRKFQDVAGLAESIAEIGLLNPIVVSDDMRLIAGLRRLEAVKRLGWERIHANIVPLEGIDAEIAEIDENLIRGNLSTAEEAGLTAERKRLYQDKYPETKPSVFGRGGRPKNDGTTVPRFDEDTSERTGKSARAVRVLTQIGESVAPDVLAAVIEQAPEIANSKTQLLELARMAPEQQQAVKAKIEEVAADPDKAERVDVRAVKRLLDEDQREAKREENRRLVSSTPPVTVVGTDTRYPVIVIDPPWTYDHDYYDRAEPLYALMDNYQIAALPVAELAADDAVLWLWTTQTHHGVALRLLETWGFTLRSELIWAKPRFGMGGWLRSQHETCLLATKGSPKKLRADVGSVLQAPLGEHSEKPEAFYAIAETFTPGPFLELFARRKRDGWAYWGAEA